MAAASSAPPGASPPPAAAVPEQAQRETHSQRSFKHDNPDPLLPGLVDHKNLSVLKTVGRRKS